MQENIDIFDFELTAEELDYISSIYDDTRSHNHPDTYRFPYERHFKTKI
jgi:diketogulonate reductase-like aldo/keto reductase